MEVAYMVEEGYALPAMLATGLPETVASAMWAVGPLLGLLFQGYLGSASDRCTCSWGKRRPFILGLAVCACLAALLFPYGSFVAGSVLSLSEESGGVFIMVFTAFTFVAMDFFLDALQSPMRAYLHDSVPARRSERANYTFTALLCAGAMAGSLIGGFPWSNLVARPRQKEDQDGGGGSGRQLEIVYGITAAVFAVCLLLCLNSVKEKDPLLREGPRVGKDTYFQLPQLASQSEPFLLQPAGNNFGRRHNTFTSLSTLKPTSIQIMCRDDLINNHQLNPPSQLKTNGIVRSISPIHRAAPMYTVVATKSTQKTSRNGCLPRFIGDVYDDICCTILFSKYTSPHFSRLCWTMFFSWAGYLSMLIYFTSFVGEVVYGGSPHSASGEPEKELFDRGVRVGFLVMLVQDFVSAGSSLCMKWVSDLLGIRRLLVGVLASYTAACFLTASCPTLFNAVILHMVAGLMYSNMQSLPYTLLSQYEVYNITKLCL